MNEPAEIPHRRSVDWISALMALVTVAALLGAAWLRSVPTTNPITVGDRAPLLQLIDLDSAEPLVMAGLKGKVVWIVFWSAEEPGAASTLAAIVRASSRIKTHRLFSLVTAAVESGGADRVRAAVAESGVELPVYLASPESRRRFGAEKTGPPLHVLIDALGQVVAIARGAGQATLDRLADQAKRQLDELDPLGNTRFARRLDSLRGWPRLDEFTDADRHELIEQRVRTERRAELEANLWVPAAQLGASGRQVSLEVDSG
jgi:hypothetical protein